MLIKLEWLGYRTVKKLWRYVKPFHLILERYGQTDGRTDRIAISISRVSVLTRDKNTIKIHIHLRNTKLAWSIWNIKITVHKQKAISIVLQINNTVQKNENSCTLVKSQYHVNSSTADGTTTSLTEHFVSARLTEMLVATWHQRDAWVKLRLAFHTLSFLRFPVLRFPPLQYGATFSILAFSAPSPQKVGELKKSGKVIELVLVSLDYWTKKEQLQVASYWQNWHLWKLNILH